MAEGFLTHPTKPAYGLALFFLTNIGLYIDLSYAETKNSNVTSAEDHGVCPKLYKGIPNVLVSVGDQIDFDIPEDAFTGNFSVIQLTANSDDEKLPRWLYYNTSSRLFEGRPEADDVGTLEIHIIVGCEDCLERCTNVSSAFSIVVQFERSTGIEESGNLLYDRCILQAQRIPRNLWAHVLAFPDLFSSLHLLPGHHCNVHEITDLALTLMPTSPMMENDKAKLLITVSQHFNVDCSKLTILPLFVYASLKKYSGLAKVYGKVTFKSLPVVHSMKYAFIVMWNVACDAISSLHDLGTTENIIDDFRSDIAVVTQWFLLTRHSKHKRRKRQVLTNLKILSTTPPSGEGPVLIESNSLSHTLPSFSLHLSISPVVSMTDIQATQTHPSSRPASTESELNFSSELADKQSKDRYVKESLTTASRLLVPSNSEHVLDTGLITKETFSVFHMLYSAQVISAETVKAAVIEGTSIIFPSIHLSGTDRRLMATTDSAVFSATAMSAGLYEKQSSSRLTVNHDDILIPSYSATVVHLPLRGNQGSSTPPSLVTKFRSLPEGQPSEIYPSSAMRLRTIVYSTVLLPDTVSIVYSSSTLDHTTGLEKHQTNSLPIESVVQSNLALSKTMFTPFENFQHSLSSSKHTEPSIPGSYQSTDTFHNLYSSHSTSAVQESIRGIDSVSFMTAKSSKVSATMEKSISHHIHKHISTPLASISRFKTSIHVEISPSFLGFPLEGSESVIARSPEIVLDFKMVSSQFLSSVPYTSFTSAEYQGFETAFHFPHVVSSDITDSYQTMSNDQEFSSSEELSIHPAATNMQLSLVSRMFESDNLSTLFFLPNSHDASEIFLSLSSSKYPYSTPTRMNYQSTTLHPSSTYSTATRMNYQSTTLHPSSTYSTATRMNYQSTTLHPSSTYSTLTQMNYQSTTLHPSSTYSTPTRMNYQSTTLHPSSTYSTPTRMNYQSTTLHPSSTYSTATRMNYQSTTLHPSSTYSTLTQMNYQSTTLHPSSTYSTATQMNYQSTTLHPSSTYSTLTRMNYQSTTLHPSSTYSTLTQMNYQSTTLHPSSTYSTLTQMNYQSTTLHPSSTYSTLTQMNYQSTTLHHSSTYSTTTRMKYQSTTLHPSSTYSTPTRMNYQSTTLHPSSTYSTLTQMNYQSTTLHPSFTYSTPTWINYQSTTLRPTPTSLSDPHPIYLTSILPGISDYNVTNFYPVSDWTSFEIISVTSVLVPSSVIAIVPSSSNSAAPGSISVPLSMILNFSSPRSVDSPVSCLTSLCGFNPTTTRVPSSVGIALVSSANIAVPSLLSYHFSSLLEPSPTSILVSTSGFPFSAPTIISFSTPSIIPISTPISIPVSSQSSFPLLNPTTISLSMSSSIQGFTLKNTPISNSINISVSHPTSILELNSTSSFHNTIPLSLTAFDQSSVLKQDMSSSIDSALVRKDSLLPSFEVSTTGISTPSIYQTGDHSISLDDSLSLSLPETMLHSVQDWALDSSSLVPAPDHGSQSLLITGSMLFDSTPDSHGQTDFLSVPPSSQISMDVSAHVTQVSDYDIVNTFVEILLTEIKPYVSDGNTKSDDILTSIKVAQSSVGHDKALTQIEATPMKSKFDEASTVIEATPLKSGFVEASSVIEATSTRSGFVEASLVIEAASMRSGFDEASILIEATSMRSGFDEASILIEATSMRSGFDEASILIEATLVQSTPEEISTIISATFESEFGDILPMGGTLSPSITFEGFSTVLESELLPSQIEFTLVTETTSAVGRTTLLPISTSDPILLSEEIISQSSLKTQLPSFMSSVMTSMLGSTALTEEPPFSTSMQTTSDASTKPNRAPILVKPLGRLSVGLGQHYQMVIPQDTFMDAEDGNTRSLILSLYRQSKADLPRSFWLQLNVTSQTIYGIPLAKDYQDHPVELVLSATDSGGSVAMDTVMVSLDAVPLKDFSHVFILTLDMEESAFMASPDILIRLTEKIGKYFGERAPGSVSILSVNKGSVIVSWANSTLSKTECQKDKINQIYSKLSNGNGGVNAKFFSSMLPEFYVSKVTVQHRGICVPFVAESPITTTTTNMSPKKHATEWNEVVLPALIVVFAILLILFVGMICFRRFRHRGKSVLRSEKDEFEEFGQPVVLQEDMELHEINGKPCRPLVMAADLEEPHPGNEWVDERPPPPEYNVPDGKRLSQPLDYDPPVEPGYDNGAYQPPPVYRIPPSYSSPGQSVA